MIIRLILKHARPASRIVVPRNPLLICGLFLVFALGISGFGVLQAGTPSDTESPQGSVQYFPETGYQVQYAFLQFFNAYGGEDVFGYPITNEYQDPISGVVMQYFDNARFEWWPDSEASQRVKLGLLGDELELRSVADPRQDGEVCWPSDVTGYFICDDFLTFYQAHGGKLVFGPPIGDAYTVNNIRAQNFQRMQMILVPDSGVVAISSLGRYSCEDRYETLRCEELSEVKCPPQNQALVMPLNLKVNVEHTKRRQGDSQILRANVEDAAGNQLCGQVVTFKLNFDAVGSNGIRPEEQRFEAVTNTNGVAEITITQRDGPNGADVTVLAEVDYDGILYPSTTQYAFWQH